MADHGIIHHQLPIMVRKPKMVWSGLVKMGLYQREIAGDGKSNILLSWLNRRVLTLHRQLSLCIPLRSIVRHIRQTLRNPCEHHRAYASESTSVRALRSQGRRTTTQSFARAYSRREKTSFRRHVRGVSGLNVTRRNIRRRARARSLLPGLRSRCDSTSTRHCGPRRRLYSLHQRATSEQRASQPFTYLLWR